MFDCKECATIGPSISIKPWFATINDFVVFLLTLIPTLIKVKRHLPSMSFYESHRRQPFITRYRSIKQTAVLRLESSSPENFGDSAILPKAKISASLIEILSSRSHKTPAIYAPIIPTGEALSPSLPQCGVDRQNFMAR